VVKNMADMAIEAALEPAPQLDSLVWSSFFETPSG
jgi:hypothetical protein